MSKGAKDRANARRIVEQQKAAARRRRVTIWTSVAVVAVLVIAGLIGWGVLAGQDKKIEASRVTTPSVAVDEGTAFAVGHTGCQMPVVRWYQMRRGLGSQNCLPRGWVRSVGRSSARTTTTCSS